MDSPAEIKQIPYGAQWIDEEDAEAVARASRGTWITRGPEVAAFEEEIAERVQARYAVAFSSGTSALTAAYYAANIEAGDRIFTSPNTFIGTITGALQKGAKVHFIDIDPTTGSMDMNLLLQEINAPSTRSKEVIVPVHFAGVSIDLSNLSNLVRSLNTVIIEDAAQALGAYDPQGNPVGSCSFSDMTIFSFHPCKTITTGEGGMVTTNDPELYHRLRLFRDNGIEREAVSNEFPGSYEVVALTGNSHMNEIQAALGRSQLKKIDKFIATRKKLREEYLSQLEGIDGLQILQGAEKSANHLFVVRIDFEKMNITRKEMIEALCEKGIGTQVHYVPLYRHPVFGASPETDFTLSYPGTELYYNTALTLPLHCHMDEKDVVHVCNMVKSILIKQ